MQFVSYQYKPCHLLFLSVDFSLMRKCIDINYALLTILKLDSSEKFCRSEFTSHKVGKFLKILLFHLR